MLKLFLACMVLILSFTAVFQVQYAREAKKRPTISYAQLDIHMKKQVDCLADNIYFEAGNQSPTGQVAVGLVTMNRVNSGVFPDSICGVVKQKTSDTCQFSWWCEPAARAKSIGRQFLGAERELYNRIRLIAMQIYFNSDQFEDVTKGATFYHATYVSPGWKGLQKTVRIEEHIFYKKAVNHEIKQREPSNADSGAAKVRLH